MVLNCGRYEMYYGDGQCPEIGNDEQYGEEWSPTLSHSIVVWMHMMYIGISSAMSMMFKLPSLQRYMSGGVRFSN